MEIIKTEIADIIIIKPNVFEDSRGYFYESYNKIKFDEKGINYDFLQDNQSLSSKGVLRGLHFQNPPYEQCKLVRVIKGAVLDVAVDIRINSPFYGKSVLCELNEKNKLMMLIPPGFAHGFLTLEEDTIFSYKCSNVYNKESEGSILWCDKDLNINWNFENPIISDKDKIAQKFNDFKSKFIYK